MNATTSPAAPPRADASGAESDAPASVEFEVRGRDELCIHVSGAWVLGQPRPALAELAAHLEHPPRRARFTADGIGAWDTSLLTWLRAASEACKQAGAEVDRSELPSRVADLLALAETRIEPPREPEPPARFLARVGRRAVAAWRETVDDVGFVGQVVQALGRCIGLRARFRRADLLRWLQVAGADAFPIVTLVSVIVGLILAFVGAVQLRQFGADIYVANMVGIGMVREMGAMVVGIVVAGRTGAAYAAQLGTMTVSQEIDALRTFGIPPIEFLVLPRVLALFLMAPFLCLYSMVIGILGGALVGIGMLGLSSQLYFDQTLRAVALGDLWGGVFRGTVYGLLVGITGCLRGMRCGNDAAAVGEATTRAVVSAIVAIAVADGVMALCFNALDI